MTIFDDLTIRENKIWAPFGYSMRFTTAQAGERVVIFGIYSGAYKNGLAYLVAYDAFELGMIVDDYNSKIEALDAEEQNALLDIVTKRYLSDIDGVIHAETLTTKSAGIEATDAEWDAKFEALEADIQAVETMRLKFEALKLNISARIQTLSAQITLEEVALDLAAVDLLKAELAVSDGENRLSSKLVDIAVKDVEIAEKDIELLRKDAEILQKDLDLLTESISLKQVQLQESQTELAISETGINALKIQNQIVELGIKKLDVERDAAQMSVQIANYEKDIAKTELLQADLTEIEAEKTLEEVNLTGKDLELSQVDLDVRGTELKKAQTDLDYVNVDLKVAGIEVDIVKTEAKIAETEVLEAQELLEEAMLSAENAKLDIYDAKGLILDNKLLTAIDETTAKETKAINEIAIHDASITGINSQHELKIDTLETQEAETLTGYTESVESAELNGTLIDLTEEPYASMTEKQIDTITSRTYKAKEIDDANVESLEKIMAAEITTSLMHSVSKS